LSDAERSKPLRFVDDIVPERHCALFYDQSDYARRIEFRFLERGLARREYCFCITHTGEETDTMRNLMARNGALRNGLESGLLRVGRDSFTPRVPEDVPKLYEERRRTWMSESFRPMRVTGMTVPEIGSPEQLATQVAVDALAQRTCKGSSITRLCSFATAKVREDLRNEWFLKMIASHEAAIFAPAGGEGIAFDMR